MQKQYIADKVTANAKTETKRGTKKSYFFSKAVVISNIARIANAVQVTICLLVSNNVY